MRKGVVMTITWSEETRNIDDLKLFAENPRYISKENYAKLIKSIKECGYNNRLLVNADNGVIGGHQRIHALRELGVKEVKVLVPSRHLSDKEYRQILITDNLDFGAYDFDILANNFDIESLLEWGMPAELLGEIMPVDVEVDDEKEEKIPCKNCPYKEKED